MSWGKGIIIVYILFSAGIGFMMYKSMSKNIDLVSPNYYEKELKYQEQINKVNNTSSLKEKIIIESTQSAVIITYPKVNNVISGDISFYKPSDAKNDFKIKIEPGDGSKQFVNTDNMQKGLWRVQINWAMDGKDYYSEEKIMVQ